MPVFRYTGLDASGRPVKGLKDAESPKALRVALKREGIYLTDVFSDAGAKGGAKGGTGEAPSLMTRLKQARANRSVSTQEVSLTTRQLATLLHAGIPLVESLQALIEQVDNEGLKRVLATVRERVNEGRALADAMAEHPKLFPHLYVNMIRAGEASGTLDSVLTRLADFMETQQKLRSKVRGAMTYPVIMVVVAVLIISVLMVVVVPKITAIFDGLGATLPLNTRILIKSSQIMSDWWWLIFPSIGLCIFGLYRYVQTPKGRARYDKVLLKLPLFGKLLRMVAISRFAKTLATMLASGVPLLRSLEIVKNVIGNTVIANVVEKASVAIREGESIAAPLRRSGEFPPLVTHMIAVGERSGQLESMLENVANNYDSEVDNRVGRLTTALEPMMILSMGVIVGFIVLSILRPILMMNEFVGGQ
jgi:general secretion pathway protein F